MTSRTPGRLARLLMTGALAGTAATAAAHRKKHALGDTGFHKSAAHVDKVRRPAFLTPEEES